MTDAGSMASVRQPCTTSRSRYNRKVCIQNYWLWIDPAKQTVRLLEDAICKMLERHTNSSIESPQGHGRSPRHEACGGHHDSQEGCAVAAKAILFQPRNKSRRLMLLQEALKSTTFATVNDTAFETAA